MNNILLLKLFKITEYKHYKYSKNGVIDIGVNSFKDLIYTSIIKNINNSIKYIKDELYINSDIILNYAFNIIDNTIGCLKCHNTTNAFNSILVYFKLLNIKKVGIIGKCYYSFYISISLSLFEIIDIPLHYNAIKQTFELDINKILECDAILITNPIFESGIKITDNLILIFLNIINTTNIKIVLDEVLTQNNNYIFRQLKINDNCFLIGSQYKFLGISSHLSYLICKKTIINNYLFKTSYEYLTHSTKKTYNTLDSFLCTNAFKTIENRYLVFLKKLLLELFLFLKKYENLVVIPKKDLINNTYITCIYFNKNYKNLVDDIINKYKILLILSKSVLDLNNTSFRISLLNNMADIKICLTKIFEHIINNY